MPGLPNFFVVGAPKAGTTSLYHYLDQHPGIYMSPIKEPCYFAAELRAENFCAEMQPRIRREMEDLDLYLRGPLSERRFGGLVAKWDDYLRLFAAARGQTAIGEASVCYLWSETAAARIHEKIQDARIVMILRNPVDRAFSQYLHGVALGWVRTSFREHIDASLRWRSKQFSPVYPFLQMGLYGGQVRRYLGLFPRDRVRIYLYEEYRANLHGVLTDLFQFLDVDANFRPRPVERHLEARIPRLPGVTGLLKERGVWQRLKKLCPEPLRGPLRALAMRPRRSLTLQPADRAYLCGFYEEDVRRLSGLLDRDLSSWLRQAAWPTACG